MRVAGASGAVATEESLDEWDYVVVSCVLSLQKQYTESMYSANGMGSARRVSRESVEEHVLEGSSA